MTNGFVNDNRIRFFDAAVVIIGGFGPELFGENKLRASSL